MDGKKQSFFQGFHKLAAHLDHGINLCNNPEFDYQSQARCLNTLKGYAEEIQEKLVESKSIYEEQESSLVKYESLFSLVEGVIDKQREVLQTQETYMEQYGYIPYEKSLAVKEKKNTEAEEPEPEPEPASTPEKNLALEKTSAEEESPQTPKLEDYKLSHYTLVQLQKSKMSFNQPTMERMGTPKVFQHDGLFMSPGVWGQMPAMYTPDVRNSAYGASLWPRSAVSSAKYNASLWCSTKKIRKNLQMEMNTEDQDILNQCPRFPSLSSVHLQNLNMDFYQLPQTPLSATKVTAQKPAEFPLSKPKDYFYEELPQPPVLSTTYQSQRYHTTLKNKLKPPSEVALSNPNTINDFKTPSPPLLHIPFSNFDKLDSPEVPAKPVLSCWKSKKKEQPSYLKRDIPKPPELTGVYHFSTRDKENFETKNYFL